MDRLSVHARAALDAFRDRLGPDAARIERNWAAIERRARGELDDELDAMASTGPRRGLRRIAVPLGISVIAAAGLTIAIAWHSWSIAAARRDAAPLHAAAYDARTNPAVLVAPATCMPSSPVSVACTPAPPSTTVAPHAEVAPPTRAPQKARKVAARRSPDAPPNPALEEIVLVRRARAALRDGDGTSALRMLDEHSQRFGEEGEFAEEATVLRITALCRSGNHVAGTKLARRFLATHGRSPLAGRAAHACENASADGP